MKRALLKDSFKQIIKTRKRFISILLMAFLGVGFFAGVRSTSPDMELTLDDYYDSKNIYDIEVFSTLGLTDDDLTELKKITGVKDVVGLNSKDVYTTLNDTELVIKVIEYSDKINGIEVYEGKLPSNEKECLIESNMAKSHNLKVGDRITISEDLKEDEDPTFKEKTLTISGIGISPLYMSRDRGTTLLGSGKLSYYVYVNDKNVVADYYTQADIIVDGAIDKLATKEEYSSLVDSVTENIKQIKETREKARYDELIEEATKKIDDAQKELDDKKAEAEEEISKAEKDIAKAKKDISDGETKIADGEKELNSQRAKADLDFMNAEKTINDNQEKLSNGQNELNANIQKFNNNEAKAYDGLVQAYNSIQGIDSNINYLKNLFPLIDQYVEVNNSLNAHYDELNPLKEEYQKETDPTKKE